MKKQIQTVLIVVLAMVAGVLVSYVAFSRGDSREARAARDVRVTKTARQGAVQKITEISLVDNHGKKSVRIVESSRSRPGAAGEVEKSMSDDVDEEELSELQKEVLKELQDALDDNDLKRVRRALSRFMAKADRGGLGGRVPVCMRRRAVEALGWFGKDAVVDLIDFAGDADAEVAAEAFSQVELALSDCEMSDRERAQITSAFLTASTDGDQIDSLLCQLNDMRNSVKAQAVRDILTKGTEAAREMMREQLGLYLDDEVTDLDGIDRWQAENPDDEGDNDIYGKL